MLTVEKFSHLRSSGAHEVRDHGKGDGLVGRDPTCRVRPGCLVEQVRRQTLQVIRLLRSFLAAPVRKVLHAGVLLVVVNGFVTPPAVQGHSVKESTTEPILPSESIATLWPRVTAGAVSVTPVTIQAMAAAAEQRRVRADYDTGSITEHEAFCLLSLAQYLSARVVIEVGTFVGLSTVALASASTVEAVYTCDASNDCLPATDVIHTYPKHNSTEMLSDLIGRRVRADLCFIDGVLAVPADVVLLSGLTHRETVFAFHDYNYGSKIRKGGKLEHNIPRKGIGNVQALQPHLPNHVLIEPQPETTLALLMPESRL